MPSFDPLFWRAAGHLEQFLKTRADNSHRVTLDRWSFQQLHVLTARLASVEQLDWQLSARWVAQQLHAKLRTCESQITSVLEGLATRFPTAESPTAAAIYEELSALREEFEVCEVDLRAGTLSVVTEPVVLEDIDLGPFRIVLNWKGGPDPAAASPYLVQAISPCCPDGQSHITHPHVMRDRLCEGDATCAVRQALRAGRLTDFFQIINQVLHTYNSHSPYAPLSDWHGTDCHACGAHVSGDCSYCDVCQTQVCDDCSSCCPHCDTSACESCLQCCGHCDSEFCPKCAAVCRACERVFCPHCLNPHDLCQECDHADASEELESDTDSSPEESGPHVAVQSLGVGQIAVPA